MATLNPCAACVSQSAYTKLLIGTNLTDWSGSTALKFLSEKLQYVRNKTPSPAITGSKAYLSTDFYTPATYVRGPIVWELSAGLANVLLPYMIGALDSGTGGSNEYEPDQGCMGSFHILIQRDYNKVFRYQNCVVERWTLESRARNLGEQGLVDMVILTTYILGKTRDVDVVTWPSPDISLGTGDQWIPYFLKDGTLEMLTANTAMGGSVKGFRLDYNRNVVGRFRMASTPTFCEGPRAVNFVAACDWDGTTSALLENTDNADGILGFSGSGTIATNFNFGALLEIGDDPNAEARDEDVVYNVRNIAAQTAAGVYDLTADNSIA